jgi:hypothetical protein
MTHLFKTVLVGRGANAETNKGGKNKTKQIYKMKTIQKMWSSLATPALLLDKSAMERNAQTMLRRAAELGVALRPNVKTHKSVEVAQLQHTGVWSDANNNNADRSAMRVCTSTLLETRHFLQHGFGDVLYAVPLAGASKVAIAQELLVQFGARVAFMVDTVEAVAALPAIDAKWPLFVKVRGSCDVLHSGSCCLMCLLQRLTADTVGQVEVARRCAKSWKQCRTPSSDAFSEDCTR